MHNSVVVAKGTVAAGFSLQFAERTRWVKSEASARQIVAECQRREAYTARTQPKGAATACVVGTSLLVQSHATIGICTRDKL